MHPEVAQQSLPRSAAHASGSLACTAEKNQVAWSCWGLDYMDVDITTSSPTSNPRCCQ